jgi:hypothetical protein
VQAAPLMSNVPRESSPIGPIGAKKGKRRFPFNPTAPASRQCEDFRHALWLFRKEALDAARSKLQLAATEAVTVVHKLLHEGSSEQIRLKAAQLLLDQLGFVGRYSANGFDGAAITPIGNYAPPSEDQSIRTREAIRKVRGALDSMRRRLGVVNPNDIAPVENPHHGPDGITRYGPPPVVVEIDDSILDKARLEFLHENAEANLRNSPPTTIKVLAERHGVNYRTLRNHASEHDWMGQLKVVIASQAGGAAT